MQSNTLELLKEHFSKSNWETMNNILGECYQENRYKITLNLLDIFGYDLRTVYMTCYTIRDTLESELFNLDVDLQIKYNKNDIIFYLKESNKMNNLLKINFVIPYGKREDYIEFIEEINNNTLYKWKLVEYVLDNEWSKENIKWLLTNLEKRDFYYSFFPIHSQLNSAYDENYLHHLRKEKDLFEP